MMAAAMSVAAVFAGEVRPTAFRQLAPGAVKPDGWLRDVLRLQAEGITGHAEELYKDIGESDWLTGGRRGGEFEWERGPYYARGLQVLAWQLDDATLKKRAQGWIEAILKSQRDDGDFGPKRENWWANMLALYMMRDNYLATGDVRCAEFVKKYARFQQTALKKKSLHGDSMWACARGGDGMEVFLDFYDLTGDAEFLEAAKLYMSQTAPWTEYYYTGSRNESYQEHIVNFNEGLKEPALVWRLTGDKRAADAYAAAMDKGGWSQLYAGRPDRMQNGEEPLSGRNASGGTELCAQAERIISCADQVSVFANVKAADDMETVAYNCLPATIYPDFTGIRYYLPLNCPRADNNKLFYTHNPQVYSITPSPHSGFGCCRSNFHIAWPKFVQSMWMATADGGLAAVAYGPCTVRAKVGGKDVAMRMVTDYPFRGKVTIEMLEGSGSFPLRVRVPSWAVGEKDAGTFRKVVRSWRRGDRLTFDFTAKTTVEKGWSFDSACVRRGPLLFAWNVPARTKVVKTFGGEFATRELHPVKEWNVALVLPESGDLASGIEVVDSGAPIKDSPFSYDRAPVKLRMRGCRTDEVRWGRFRYEANGTCVEPPPSPIRAPRDWCTLELVPLGCTQTRVTLFPWTSSSECKVKSGEAVYGGGPVEGVECRASHCWGGDTVDALVDGKEPKNSNDRSIPRFTTWDHKGGEEWVEVRYPKARDISSVSVYWFEDGEGCALPASWRVQLERDGKWTDAAADATLVKDAYSKARLSKKETVRAFRVVFAQKPEKACGILEVRAER